MKTAPLLTIGTYGTHLTENPAGSFSFVGSIPIDLNNKTYSTYENGLNDFVKWFKSMPADEQRVHVPNLRNDVFITIFEF